MLRRLAQTGARPTARLGISTRNYFVAGTGEEGIWGATMSKTFYNLFFIAYVPMPLFLYRVVYRRYCPDQQWVCSPCDKWYSDGTEMDGEEATANLRIQRERIMPIMDSYLEAMELSKGVGGGGGHRAAPAAAAHH